MRVHSLIERELSTFRDILTQKPSHHLVFVSGPAGIGKTCLLHRFLGMWNTARVSGVPIDLRHDVDAIGMLMRISEQLVEEPIVPSFKQTGRSGFHTRHPNDRQLTFHTCRWVSRWCDNTQYPSILRFQRRRVHHGSHE